MAAASNRFNLESSYRSLAEWLISINIDLDAGGGGVSRCVINTSDTAKKVTHVIRHIYVCVDED